MGNEENLTIDEGRRIEQHEKVKEGIRQEIHKEIKTTVDEEKPDAEHVKAVAEGLKHKMVSEVTETEAELDRGRKVARTSQVLDYAFFLIYGIVGMEIVLELFGAHQSSGFKKFIDAISIPFLAPFRSLFWDPGIGPFRFMFSYMFAFVFFVLLHFATSKLLRIFFQRKTVV